MTYTERLRRSARLLVRLEQYRAVHPVTYRGVGRAAGCDHRYLSEFCAHQRKTMPEHAIMSLEKFLQERGF